MTSPAISVILPTYNRRQYICDAIDSVLAQTSPVHEIVVVDDGSSDDTAGLLKSRYGGTLRYIAQKNLGPAAARNRGMREASGTHFAFLDSDDVWLPAKTELQCSFLRQHADVEFIFGDMCNFTQIPIFAGSEIKSPEIRTYLSANCSNLSGLLDCLVVENVIPTPTVLISRRAAERIGQFDETLRVAEDLDYWLRVARSCRCGFVDRVLIARRRHGNNLVDDTNLRHASLLQVLQRAAAELRPECAGTRRRIDSRIGEVSYDLGSALLKRRRFGEALEYFEQARRAGRNSMKLRTKVAVAAVLGRLLAPGAAALSRG